MRAGGKSCERRAVDRIQRAGCKGPYGHSDVSQEIVDGVGVGASRGIGGARESRLFQSTEGAHVRSSRNDASEEERHQE